MKFRSLSLMLCIFSVYPVLARTKHLVGIPQNSNVIHSRTFIISRINKSDTFFKPGQQWFDDKGQLINAHGGGLLYARGRYYWYGEARGISHSKGVYVYSSKNLYNWKYEGIALSQDKDTTSDIALGCIMERPKVVYNKFTGRYVMWFHLEMKGRGYSAARAGVAVGSSPAGPFKFIKSFRPNGNMARDMGLFTEGNNAYLLYSSDENYDLRIVELSKNYCDVTSRDSLLFRKHQEAPAIFKYKNKYWLITSGCTGWAPNRASLHVADHLFGTWNYSGDPMIGENGYITFGAQSTFILPIVGKKNAFVFMADKWNPHNLQDSRYVWLPVKFKNDRPAIEWTLEWSLSLFKGHSD